MRQRLERKIQVVTLILAGTISWSVAAAQTAAPVSLDEQLQAQYKLVKMGADSSGPAVVEAGTILAIQKGGILGVPYGNMTLLPAKYQDGTLHPPALATSNSATAMGQKVCGLFGKCNSAKEQVGKQTTTRLFQVGEKVYPSKIDVNLNSDRIALSIVACDSCNNVNPTTYYKSQVVFQFAKGSLAKTSAAQVEDTIGQVFSIDNSTDSQQAQAQGQDSQAGQGQAAEQQPPAQPQTIQQGQTPEEVQASLGQPEKIIKLGSKQIYVYKDLKVTFMNGKVSDVQ